MPSIAEKSFDAVTLELREELKPRMTGGKTPLVILSLNDSMQFSYSVLKRQNTVTVPSENLIICKRKLVKEIIA